VIMEQKIEVDSNSEKDLYINKKQKWRGVISRKNKVWFDSKENVNNFDLSKSDEIIYNKIRNIFENEKTRNFGIHLATNFLPLNNPSQCPILPSEKYFCKISEYELTDLLRIKTGDRNKSMGYVGLQSNVVLSADAIRELYKFVIQHIIKFDTQLGQILNHAFDKIRLNDKKHNL